MKQQTNTSTLTADQESTLATKVAELQSWTDKWNAGTVYVYAIFLSGSLQCFGHCYDLKTATNDYNYNTKTYHAVEPPFEKINQHLLESEVLA
jgi:hypothetical protein